MVVRKKTALAGCKDRLDVLLEMRMKNEIGADFFQDKKRGIEQEMADLQDYINRAEERISEWFAKAESRLGFAAQLTERFKGGNKAKRKEILQLLGYNHLLKGKKLCISIQKPLLLFSEMQKLSFSDTSRLEPQKIKEIKDSLEVSA